MRTLKLTTEEVVHLISRIKNEETDFEDAKPLGRAVLIKLFSLFNQMTTDDKLKDAEEAATFTEQELWLMRGKVSPFDKMDGKPVGLKLLRKIHSAILSINSDLQLKEAEVDEETYAERKERADARREADEDDAKDRA